MKYLVAGLTAGIYGFLYGKLVSWFDCNDPLYLVGLLILALFGGCLGGLSNELDRD